MDIVFVGLQGAGKGTQADLLAAKLGIPHVASGDLLRSAIERHTDLGQQAQPFYDRGDLVPDRLIVELFLACLAEPESGKGAILDGFPRTLAQAQALDQALAAGGRAVDAILYLQANPTSVVKRLAQRYLCRAHHHPYHLLTHPPQQPSTCDRDGSPLYQRSDDTEEAVRRRVQVFFEETSPLLEYYGAQGKVREIDAEQPIAEVAAAILRALGKNEAMLED